MAFEPGLFSGPTIERRLREQREDREEAERRAASGNAAPARSVRQQGAGGMFGVPVYGPNEQRAIANQNLAMAMNAIENENESRVNQRREMRRLGMDYETERLRQMGANQRAQIDAEASLIRELLAGM